MSSIKRGVRKVFRGAKRVVRKIAKPALAVGAIYLTAGLATGAFSAAQIGSSIGGFFKSVGATISNGASAIAGAFGKEGAVGGLLSKAGKAFGSLSDPVKTAIFSGLGGAFKDYQERKEIRRAERRADETGLFGARRRGGGGLIESDFGAAVRTGFGLDEVPATAATGLLEPAPMPDFRQIDPRQQEEDEEVGTLAGGFGLERGLLAQSQLNMPQFV